jgi:hypothetical protein
MHWRKNKPCFFLPDGIKFKQKGRDTMDDKEKIESFGDMVQATERLTKPWRIALLATNIAWAVVMLAFILLAYLTPVEMAQDQQLPDGTQSQSYTEGVTGGK